VRVRITLAISLIIFRFVSLESRKLVPTLP
jgi:hypothetical protein